MGGPWRDRNYVPSVPKLATPTPARMDLIGDHEQLGPYLAGIVIGAILGIVGFYLAIPYLPFVQGR